MVEALHGDVADGVLRGAKEVFLPDDVHIAAPAHRRQRRILEAGQVEPAALVPQPFGLLGEQFGAGDVDKIHARADDEHVILAPGGEFGQSTLDMAHRAEEQRAVHA